MALLKELIDKNTMVFFTSDNGSARGRRMFDSCGPCAIRSPLCTRAAYVVP